MATDKRAAALVTETDLHGSDREAPSFVRRFRRLAAQVRVERGFGRWLPTEHPFAA
jgi:hypothetical protein